MIRVGVALATIVAVVVTSAVRPAEAACSTQHEVDQISGAYVTTVVCHGRTEKDDGGAGPGPGGPSHLEPRLRADDDLGACLDSVRVPGPPDPHANDLGVLDSILAVVPPCPAAGLGRVRPVTVATGFWARTPLAKPEPVIDPHEPVTGRDAFLVVGADLRPTIRHDTPLGPLVISAVGQPSVAWGDGSVSSGEPGKEGGVHPDGAIRHVYERRGPVTLTVTVTWRATWSLAGESGSLPSLRTTGRVALTVREVQAVLTG